MGGNRTRQQNEVSVAHIPLRLTSPAGGKEDTWTPGRGVSKEVCIWQFSSDHPRLRMDKCVAKPLQRITIPCPQNDVSAFGNPAQLIEDSTFRIPMILALCIAGIGLRLDLGYHSQTPHRA